MEGKREETVTDAEEVYEEYVRNQPGKQYMCVEYGALNPGMTQQSAIWTNWCVAALLCLRYCLPV